MSFRPKGKTILDPSLQLGMTGSARHLASLRLGGKISSFAHVPIFVQRPARAIRARRPAPLVRATRTVTTRAEGIPTRAATVSKIFRILARRAEPAVRWFRMPLAEWTTDAGELRDLVSQRNRFFRDRNRRRRVLKQQPRAQRTAAEEIFSENGRVVRKDENHFYPSLSLTRSVNVLGERRTRPSQPDG